MCDYLNISFSIQVLSVLYQGLVNMASLMTLEESLSFDTGTAINRKYNC